MHSKSKLWRLAIVFFALAVVLAGCTTDSGDSSADPSAEGGETGEAGDTGSSGGKVFKYAKLYDDMASLDVHLHTTTDVMQAANPIGEPLVRVDEEGELYPVLLDALPDVSDDGTEFTFKLKEGVKFHDGSELTSDDVLFTFTRIFTPETQCLNTWLVDMIKGATDMLEGNADSLEGITIIDDYNFVIELEEPYAPFVAALACEQVIIYPRAACEEAGSDWGRGVFVGTGPFELVEFESKDFMHAKKFADYHGEPAKVDELYLYASMDRQTALMEYEAGNLDMVWVPTEMVTPYLSNEYADQVVKVDLIAVIAMNMNVNIAPLDDVRVREAITYAIDQEALVNSFLQGLANPTHCMIPPGVAGHDSSRPATRYNPETAKQLLADAGYPDGIDLVSYVAETDDVASVAVVLQEQLKASGINLEVNKIDRGTYIDMRKEGEVQVPFLTWYKDITDPDNFLYTFYHSSNSTMFSSNWNDSRTDELMAQGRASLSGDRTQIYVELENYLVNEECIVVPLYNPVNYYLVSEGVTGVFYDDNLLRFDTVDKNA